MAGRTARHHSQGDLWPTAVRASWTIHGRSVKDASGQGAVMETGVGQAVGICRFGGRRCLRAGIAKCLTSANHAVLKEKQSRNRCLQESGFVRWLRRLDQIKVKGRSTH